MDNLVHDKAAQRILQDTYLDSVHDGVCRHEYHEQCGRPVARRQNRNATHQCDVQAEYGRVLLPLNHPRRLQGKICQQVPSQHREEGFHHPLPE